MMNLRTLIEDNLETSYLNFYSFAISASNRYKVYTIPKKNGKERIINHPSKKLKQYQRFLVKHIFSKFPIHNSVYSYKENTSIEKLASLHKNSKYLLRIDFKDFFPSLKGEYIRTFIDANTDKLDIKLSSNDITLINLIVCKYNKLTIGAPSSPIISNILLYEFDKAMDIFSDNIIYSRYADDLYFSASKPDLLKEVIFYIKHYLERFFIKLDINHDKTIFTSKKHKMEITGLVITTDNKVSIGRKKKRYIKSLVFKYINKNIEPKEYIYLKGYLSFIQSVEIGFLNSLEKKYGADIIKRIRK